MDLPFSSKIHGSVKVERSSKYFVIDTKTFPKDEIHIETIGTINKKKYVMGFLDRDNEFIIKEITSEKKDKEFESQVKKLNKLKKLKDDEIIDVEEYLAKKAEYLKKIKF